MGSRGNIEIQQGSALTDSVFLYTHSTGHRISEILATALNRQERWDDPSYLTSIIFQAMLEGDESATGYGISVGKPDDNDHPIPTVWWGTVNSGRGKRLLITLDGRTVEADEFIREHLPAEVTA